MQWYTVSIIKNQELNKTFYHIAGIPKFCWVVKVSKVASINGEIVSCLRSLHKLIEYLTHNIIAT